MATTRRQFLGTAAGASLVSLSPAVPNFLLQASAAERESKGDTILVVVQLSGGNDGLNTVVPYADDEYYKNRTTLAIGRGQVHKIDDRVGLHPAMNGFAELLEAGRLAVVQGVGYPNPNRSHFESMDIWHTARQKDSDRSRGWLGRYLDAWHQADGGDVPALHLGGEDRPLALAARRVQVPSLQTLERFRLRQGNADEIRRSIEAARTTPDGNDLLQFVQSSTTAALRASQRVESAAKNYQTGITYPATGLAGKLRTVAQLIDAGLATRIYYVAIDGFDTHSNQAAAHTNLLREVSGAVAAFVNDLSEHGHDQRVLVMTFSEFGRRVEENASRGTDHGAAAPMFLAGARVRAGLAGKHPSLTDLDRGDLKYHTDFRQVYAAVLQDWLGWNSEAILGKAFKPLAVVTT